MADLYAVVQLNLYLFIQRRMHLMKMGTGITSRLVEEMRAAKKSSLKN